MNGKKLKWLGIVLIIVTGLIHFIETPEYYGEAAYMGVLFALNGIGSLAAAYGIYKNQKWGWILGLLIAAGSIVGYIVSRTIGMPDFPIQEWADTTGILSILVEALFSLLAVKMLSGEIKANLDRTVHI